MLSRHSFRHRFAAWLVDGQGALGNGQRVLGSGVVMARVGIGAGVGVALFLSGLWFLAMLKTSEMPH